MTYEIDGTRFGTLDEFFREFEAAVIPGVEWGRNLDAFVDVLRGFGTPPEGFTLVWRKHAVSKDRLGHIETVRALEARLRQCHPDNRGEVTRQLDAARAGQGPTVFDWLVEIIRDCGANGTATDGRVGLVLD